MPQAARLSTRCQGLPADSVLAATADQRNSASGSRAQSWLCRDQMNLASQTMH
jgi:hypothetical protein